MKFPTQVNR